MRLDLKILYGGVFLIISFILVTKLDILENPFLLNNYNVDLVKVISTNVSIIGTIFAITISLTLLGFQYLSQNISSRIVDSFFKSRFITGMIVLYIFSILFNAFVLSFLQNQFFVYISYILLALCLTYLVSYMYFMIDHLQPQKILEEIEKRMSKKDYRDINHTVLEQTVIKAIRNNDFPTFSKSSELLFKRQKYFLDELLSKEITSDWGYEARHIDAENISYYFLRMENQIYFEIIKERNELFLNYYIKNIKEIHVLLLKLMAIRPYREIRDHFNDIGFRIIELKLHGTYDYYCRLLKEISVEEFNNLPNGDLLIEFQDKIENFNNLTKNEQDKRTLGHIIFGYFEYDRLKFLSELSKEAMDIKAKHINSMINYTLSDLIIFSIKKTTNKKMRFFLMRSILEKLKEIYLGSIDKGAVSEYLTYPLNSMLRDITDEETINTIGLMIAKYCCFANIEGAKTGYYSFNLGYDGRVFVTEKRFEKIMDEITDCMITIFKISLKNEKLKPYKDHIVNDLYSFRDWGNHHNEKVRLKVDKIIKRYGLKSKKIF